MAIVFSNHESSSNEPICRPFTLYSKQHLVTRLKPTAKGEISIENFLKVKLIRKLLHKIKRI